EGLSRIECEPGFEERPECGFTSGVGDVENCFHRLRLPDGMHRCFALRPIPAKYTKLRGTVGRDALIYPCLASFPMGFTWPLWVAQRCSEAVLDKVSQLGPSRRITDHAEPIVPRKGGEVQYALYVDNLGVLGGAEPPAQLALGAGCAALGAVGLKTHERELLAGGGETLGRMLDGRQLETRVTEMRRWRIDGAFRWALRRRRLSGKQLERLVGHATFVSLLDHTALNVFNACYAFIHRCGDSMAVAWPTVRHELQAFIGLLPLVRAPWDLPWCETVVATDASLEGWGRCRCLLTAKPVASIARVPEVSRFRRIHCLGARAAASAALYPLHDDDETHQPPPFIDTANIIDIGEALPTSPGEEEWTVDSSFPENDLISPWRVTGKGKWKFGERILELEARALVLGLESLIAEGMEASWGRSAVLARRRAAAKRAACLGPPRPAAATPALCLERPSPPAGRPRKRKLLRPPTRELPLAAAPRQAAGWRALGVAAPKLLGPRTAPRLESPSVEEAVTGPLLAAAGAEAGSGLGRGEAAAAAESSDSDNLDDLTVARCKRRRSKYLVDARHAMGQLGILLESEAAQPKTREYYHLLVSRFFYWAKQRRLGPHPPGQLDGTPCIHMTELFLSGRQANNVREKLLAGVLHVLPEFGEGGEGLATAVSWSKPASDAAVCARAAACHWLIERGMRHEAAAILLGFMCYLRPSELLCVRCGHFVAPAGGVSRNWSLLLAPEELGIPTKAGTLDDSLQLDTMALKWLDVAWRELNAKPAAERAFPSSYQDLLADVQAAGATLGLKLVPYQLRHSGASYDWLRQLRGLPEMMKRGRWRKLKSVARYEKHARVGLEFGKLDARTRSHCVRCEPLLADVFLGRRSPLTFGLQHA
ncbi:unnamed protein product, partial [Prorocentrum cordatum]